MFFWTKRQIQMTNTDEYLRWLAQKSRNIVLTTHHNPDADAIGSSLALSRYLQKKGHQTLIILPNELPNYLQWIAQPQEFLAQTPHNTAICEKAITDAELIFCVDFSTYSRLQGIEQYVKNATAKIFLLDHHLSPNMRFDFSHWNPNAPASAELVYELIENVGDLHLLDTTIAEGIYAGLLTDTSSFKHASTPKTHEIVAKFITLGLNTAQIHQHIYETNSLAKLQFTGFALQHKLHTLPNQKIAYFDISQQDIEKFGITWGDTEGLVDYALSLEGIDIGVILIEKEDHTKFSFRSANHVAIDGVARQYFNGGGHAHAAGGKLFMPLRDAVAYFLEKTSVFETEKVVS